MKIKLNKDIIFLKNNEIFAKPLPRKPSVWIGTPDQKSLASSHASDLLEQQTCRKPTYFCLEKKHKIQIKNQAEISTDQILNSL